MSSLPPELEEAVAEAIADAEDASYTIRLVRLVDGESTYELTMDGEEAREFPSHTAALHEVTGRRSERRAQAALRSIQEAGYAVVPVEPTEAMRRDGGLEASLQDYDGRPDERLAANIYRAMISQYHKTEGK